MINRRNLRRIGIFCAASLAVTMLTACDSESSSGGKAALRLALNNTSASLAAVVAEQKGFFKKEGLTVQTTVLNDITKIPPALGKQFDIGFGVQPLMIRASTQGLPVTMVSGNEFTTAKKPEIMLVTRADSGITSAKDMKGKKLGAPTLTGNLHLGSLYWLKMNGVDPTSVTSVQVASPSMIDQLNAKRIDVAEMQQPFINLAKSKGLKAFAYPLEPVGDPAQLSSWQADLNWAKSHGSDVTKFKAALTDAEKWMTANPKETRDILAKFTKLSSAIVAESPLPEFTTDNSKESVEQWDKVMRGVTDFGARVDYNKLVFNP